jgi:uncharacterized membrane protein
MSTKSNIWVDIALVVFTAAVALIYFGGFYYPGLLGAWTGLGMMVYLVVLIFAGLYGLFQWLGRSKGSENDLQDTKKGAKRS